MHLSYENVVGHHVIHDGTGDSFGVQNKWQADEIIKRFNSYEAMREALQEALEFVKSECDAHDSGEIVRGDFSLLETLEKALSK